jgi:predicted AlkP superfamily pyrophosphatase or phosphodiesterase
MASSQKTKKKGNMKNTLAVSILACLTGSFASAQLLAKNQVRHILLISVDGMTELDYQLWVKNNPTSAIGQLAAQGLHYSNAYGTKPGDSIPATVGIFTGATPAVAGLYYDDFYNRAWFVPSDTTCTTPAGTVGSLKQDIDFNPLAVDGGASANGGAQINPALLPRQLVNGNCVPVYPHNQMRANTVFEVVKESYKGVTAFSEKRPSYEFLQGPSGDGVSDLFLLEINANSALNTLATCETFDSLRTVAVLNWIKGKDHTGTTTIGVPQIFGMNFQSVNAAKKDYGTSGYVDSIGTPDSNLQAALTYVDQNIGSFVAALAAAGLTESTAVIVMAKHGESPQDPAHRNVQSIAASGGIPTLLSGLGLTPITTGTLKSTNYKITNKTAALIWLGNQAMTETVATALIASSNSPGNPLNIAEVLWGSSLQQLFPDPTVDAAPPDIIVIPNLGTNYESPTVVPPSAAEHGGFNENELHVPITIAHNTVKHGTVMAPVTTTQLAPTMLNMLGISPSTLTGVTLEGTAILPQIPNNGPLYFPWFLLP